MHKSQVFALILLSFVIGIAVASFVTLEDNNWKIIFLAMLSFGALVMALSIRQEGQKYLLAGLFIVSLSFGFARYNSYHLIPSQLSRYATGDEVIVGGYVDGDVAFKNGRSSFVLRVKVLNAQNNVIGVDEKILVTQNGAQFHKYGQWLAFKGKLKMPENFDGFDYISFLKKDGISVVMTYPDDVAGTASVNIGAMENIKITVWQNIFVLRDNFSMAIVRSMPEPSASFVNGILLGLRQDIPQDIKDSFARTGTSHILAISGYNISIVAWAILFGLCYFVKRKSAFWISLFVILVFTIMTGASASVVRAAIMGMIVLFAGGFGRVSDVGNAILLGAGVMLFYNPMSLRFDAGFQLSFVAVLGLVYISPPLNFAIKTKKIPREIKELIFATLSAQIAVLPLLIYSFETLSLWSLPANVLILPLIPPIMFFGFLSGSGGIIFGFLGQIFGWMAWALSQYVFAITGYFSQLPGAGINAKFGILGLVISYIVVILLVLWGHSRIKNQLN